MAQRPLPAKAAVGTPPGRAKVRRGTGGVAPARPLLSWQCLVPGLCLHLWCLCLRRKQEAEALRVEPPDPSQERVSCPRSGRGLGWGERPKGKRCWPGPSGLRVSAIEILIERRVQRPVWEPEEHHPRARAWHFRIDAHHLIITRAPSQELADSPGPLFLSEPPRKTASTRERENQSRKLARPQPSPKFWSSSCPLLAGRRIYTWFRFAVKGPQPLKEAGAGVLKEAGAGVRGACW